MSIDSPHSLDDRHGGDGDGGGDGGGTELDVGVDLDLTLVQEAGPQLRNDAPLCCHPRVPLTNEVRPLGCRSSSLSRGQRASSLDRGARHVDAAGGVDLDLDPVCGVAEDPATIAISERRSLLHGFKDRRRRFAVLTGVGVDLAVPLDARDVVLGDRCRALLAISLSLAQPRPFGVEGFLRSDETAPESEINGQEDPSRLIKLSSLVDSARGTGVAGTSSSSSSLFSTGEAADPCLFEFVSSVDSERCT